MIQKIRYYARSALTLAARLRPSPGALYVLLAGRSRTPRPIGLRRSRARFLVRSRMDLWTIKEVCLDRDYDRAGTPLSDGWTIVDIGAGIGEFAIDAALRHPTSVVHAFEPSPSAFRLLCDNIALNRVSNVHPYPFAVVAMDGPVWLDVGHHETARHHVVDGPASANTRVEVPGLSLDAAFRQAGISRSDFLKVDCEGGEHDLFLHASSDALASAERICLEYHDSATRHHDELAARFTAEGFQVRRTENPAYAELGFLYAWRR